MPLVRVDMHCHTSYSRDSVIEPEVMSQRYVRSGLHAVCVTDHDTIDGALHMQRIAPFKVVVGEEISTHEGELIGLFLSRAVQPGLSAAETIEAIHEQGGLAVVPHPFDRLRRFRLDEAVLESVAAQVDIIETFNSRTLLMSDNERTASWAKSKGIVMGGGSDAHTPGEIGTAYVEMPPFAGPTEFLAALRQGIVVGRRSNPFLRMQTTFTRFRKQPRSRGRSAEATA
ncbi:MAG TPA: PHP domain-containing protein [Dehalococcoidia bacterium]|nr:PHP domain-containing protein [Dehalococcoidia bacterium]